MSIKDIQGLRFTKDGLTFKASQIKRDLTFANIVLYLDENAKKGQGLRQLISSRQGRTISPDKSLIQDRKSVKRNHTSTHLAHLSASLHWVCSTPTTLSMTPKMKISAVVCNRRRKRNEGQDYSL